VQWLTFTYLFTYLLNINGLILLCPATIMYFTLTADETCQSYLNFTDVVHL